MANIYDAAELSAATRAFPSKDATLPAKIADEGRVRMGGQAPIFHATNIKDNGKVRLGGQGPIFR